MSYEIIEPRKWPKQKARDKTAKKRLAARHTAMDEYRQAYVKLFNVAPSIVDDGVYFRIVGNTSGVTLQRLRTMTTQLKHRM